LKYYQAWFGTYIVEADHQLFSLPNDRINTHSTEITKALLIIGVMDQSSWLAAMGCPDPFGVPFKITDHASTHFH
jgi:hypothetical protein